jgi:uncharacterized protein
MSTSPGSPQDPQHDPTRPDPTQQPPTGGYVPQPPPGPPGHPVQQPGYAAPPTSEERTWALVAHVGTLVAAWFAMGFICPLVIMLIKGNESPFVRRHAVESLNFQISLLIYLIVSAVLVLLVVGIFMLIALGIFALVVIIMATIAASNGQDYRYPLTIRLVS